MEFGSGGRGFVFGAGLSVEDSGKAFGDSFDAAVAESGIEGAGGSDTAGPLLIDVLVNNAGVFLAGGIVKVGTSVLQKNLQVNTVAPYSIVHHGLDRLCDGTRVVNTSSGAAKGVGGRDGLRHVEGGGGIIHQVVGGCAGIAR
ncbi:hypothetical protein [Corynebacterium lactis]|uniref:hypothetical protein n=1 Tax=Corynebacterium lactis TaxID=1231000 RepID=UPI0006A97259|nr:hypothetical protein [Corynebacterium lactis]